MSKLDLMNLGELYRELRTARGLKMKDIAGKSISQSQLSKFETGQTMLSADKLLIAISSIHMSFSEFEHAYNQYENSPFFRHSKEISDLHSAKDIDGLNKLLKNYDKSSESYDIYNQLNRLVIKCAVYDLDSTNTICKEDIELLTKYLYSIENWTEYELYIFGNTLHILSESDLIFLGKAFIERVSLYLSIPNNKFHSQLVLLNIIITLLYKKQGYYADYFMKHLDEILTYQDMFAKTILIFLQKVLDYQEKRITDTKSLEEYISLIKATGHDEVAAFLQENLDAFISIS